MLYFPTIISVLEVLAVTIPVLLTVAFVTVAERKTMASMQRRLGPNAVGWYGLLQAFADALKLLLKEYVSPTQANIVLFFLGPIITLIFALLGYAVIPYGPGLMLLDYNLGILYMLAMSSLATYGILLAGLMISPLIMWIISKTSGEFQGRLFKSQFEAKYSLIFLTYLVSIRYGIAFFFNKLGYWWDYKCSTTSKWDSRKINKFNTSARNLIIIIYFLFILIYLNYTPIDLVIYIKFIYLYLILIILSVFSSLQLTTNTKYSNNSLHYRSINYPNKYNKRGKRYYSTGIPNRYNALCRRYYSTHTPNEYQSIEELKPLHYMYIKDLYKDRNANVKPFEDKVLATCEDIYNKSEFIKKWGSVSCIYLIEYKHDPLVYYIGRTNLFKRRISNHLLANSKNKFHLFINLIGWEHFKTSIIEVKSATELGARENYYLQKYLPLLNTTFSSSFSETQIYETLTNKLLNLKNNSVIYENGKSKEIYVYTILKDHIDINYYKYKSITETSKGQKIARGTISLYMDTNIPFKGKLYYSNSIFNLKEIFDLVKNISNELNLNSNIAKKVWAYDAKTLELIKGSPFVSKTQASKVLSISRDIISYFIDTNKAEGIKGTYLFSNQLNCEEINKLLNNVDSLKLGNKKEVWIYDAETLKLVNNVPYPSLKLAAEYLEVEYRTIKRHLDTKISSSKKVYLFSKELDLATEKELLEKYK
jgi:hypothetical protein